MSMSRRNFIKRAAFSSIAAAAVLSGANRGAAAIESSDEYATIIDLSKCDGCKNADTQVVLQLAGTESKPVPQPRNQSRLQPQAKHEDWSNKRELTIASPLIIGLMCSTYRYNMRDRNMKLTFPVVACIAIILLCLPLPLWGK